MFLLQAISVVIRINSMNQVTNASSSQRLNVAVVGPYGSGKSTLLESMLFLTGAINRKGAHISDSSPEATQRSMGVEVTIAECDYQDIHLTFLDCPGSIEFAQETDNALVGAGTAIVVCEPDLDKVLILAPVLKFLNDWRIPHLLFINKMNRGQENFQQLLEALSTIAQKPLVPQQYPIWQNHELVGYIDLVTEQAYHYHPNSPADPVPFPEELGELEK